MKCFNERCMTSKRTITQSLPQIISTEDDELNLKPNNLLFNYAFGFQNDQSLFPKILIKQFFATATPHWMEMKQELSVLALHSHYLPQRLRFLNALTNFPVIAFYRLLTKIVYQFITIWTYNISLTVIVLQSKVFCFFNFQVTVYFLV